MAGLDRRASSAMAFLLSPQATAAPRPDAPATSACRAAPRPPRRYEQQSGWHDVAPGPQQANAGVRAGGADRTSPVMARPCAHSRANGKLRARAPGPGTTPTRRAPASAPRPAPLPQGARRRGELYLTAPGRFLAHRPAPRTPQAPRHANAPTGGMTELNAHGQYTASPLRLRTQIPSPPRPNRAGEDVRFPGAASVFPQDGQSSGSRSCAPAGVTAPPCQVTETEQRPSDSPVLVDAAHGA